MHVSLYILLLLFVLVVFVSQVESKCPQIKVRKDTIIRTKESIRNGAKLLLRTNVNSSRYCYDLCCTTKDCNIGVMHYKRLRTFRGDIETRKTCYIFACGMPSVCTFMDHTGYAVIEMERDKETESSDEKPHRTIPKEEACPPGSPVAMCASDPCENAICHGHKDAKCVPNFCGGCGSVFYNSHGKKLLCQTKHKNGKNKQLDKNRTSGKSNKNNGARKEKEEETNGDGQVVKEEEVEVHPEETSGKPKEELFGNGGKEEDPHKVHEYRDWLDSKDELDSSAKPQTETKLYDGETKEPGLTPLMKKPGGKVILKKGSAVSWALLIALSICIVVLLVVIIKLKCLGPKKRKKFAVDDGDYLINGMYL